MRLNGVYRQPFFPTNQSAFVTASASGVKGHEELKLIMKAVQTNFTDQTTLHIQGVKSKVHQEGRIIDDTTDWNLKNLSIYYLLVDHLKNDKEV